jgi:hypothetical protein
MDSPDRPRRRRARGWWVAVIAVVLVTAVAGAWYAFGRGQDTATVANANANANANEAMAARAQQVMPFDLNRTSHTFTKTADGGEQTVVVNDPADTSDLELIRSHLSAEAEQFRSGNYEDPAKIHGMNMPGVKQLADGAAQVTVVFAPLPNGAQITYSSTDPALISALHAWFDRQSTDHSMPGMGG